MTGEWILFGVLAALSIPDILIKRIPRKALWTGIGICLLYQCIAGKPDWKFVLGGICIGLAVFAISFLSEGRVGIADGYVFLMTGIIQGFWFNIWLLVLSLLLGFSVGICQLKFGKEGKETGTFALPLVPFICLADLILIIWKIST